MSPKDALTLRRIIGGAIREIEALLMERGPQITVSCIAGKSFSDMTSEGLSAPTLPDAFITAPLVTYTAGWAVDNLLMDPDKLEIIIGTESYERADWNGCSNIVFVEDENPMRFNEVENGSPVMLKNFTPEWAAARFELAIITDGTKSVVIAFRRVDRLDHSLA